jgi:hypothetical protein
LFFDTHLNHIVIRREKNEDIETLSKQAT